MAMEMKMNLNLKDEPEAGHDPHASAGHQTSPSGKA
jgi:hypothetical protein